jgi:Ala-tRNA(Pro) deacylase
MTLPTPPQFDPISPPELAEKHPKEEPLFALLDQLGIAHHTEEHRAVFTVEEGADVKARLPGGHTKNLFLKDKAGTYVLISALGTTEIRLNHLHKRIGTKRLSFGKPEALKALLDVVPGSVTVFSVLNDTEGKVRLILDKALFDHDDVWFHPLRNTASTRVASADLLRFADGVNHPATLIDFTEDLS